MRDGLAGEEHFAGRAYRRAPRQSSRYGAAIHGLARSLFGGHIACRAHDVSSCVARMVSVGELTEEMGAVAPGLLASPKSTTLTAPSGVTFKLAALRSR